MPERIQLSRRKGWRMPPNTVNVARPTIFSNPFKIGSPSGCDFGDGGPEPLIKAMTREQCVEFYRTMSQGILTPEMHPNGHRWVERLRAKIGGYYPFEWIASELRGKNLACWCPLDGPCHADVLLKLASPEHHHAE